MEEVYARVLKELLDSGKNPKQAVSLVQKALGSKGASGLLPRVGRAFARLMAREERKKGIILSVADKKDEARARKEAAEFIPKEAEVQVRIDDTLIGGWRLNGGGHLVDASFKKQLLSMYNHATQ